EAAAVDLADVDRLQLEQLLEDDAVLDMLARRHPHGRDRVADPPVAEDVVGARRRLDPPRPHLRQPADCVDRLPDAPRLVRVEREPVLRADRLADDAYAPQIALEVAADLHLQVRETLEQRLPRTIRQRRLRIAEPAGGRRVRGEAVAEQDRL